LLFFISLFKTFKYSYNMRQLARLIVYSTIYATAATYLNVHYLEDAYQIDIVFFSLIGVILSLFLVFRLNSGYERWWQGREAWGKLVNDARNFALQLDTIIPPDDSKRRKYFSRHISNFCASLVWHLRDDMNSAHYLLETDEPMEEITSLNHQPNKFASYLVSIRKQPIFYEMSYYG
jgi:putative membrane protein